MSSAPASATPPPPGPPAPQHRGHRLWIPLGILGLAFVVLIGLQLPSDTDRNLRLWGQFATLVVALALTLLWFLLLSRIRWSRRLLGLALLAVAALVLRQRLEVDGTLDGRGLPRLVWKGTRPRVPTPVPSATTTPAPAELTSTSPPAGTEPAPAPTDFPQFQGPARNGVLTTISLSRDWTSRPPRELWRQPVGAGWSGFALVAGRAYTQEQEGENESTTCRDAHDGRLLWRHSQAARFFQWQGGEGPRATPTVDRGLVFAFGGTGILDCLDAHTGARRWSRAVFAEHQLENLLWGASASPLVFGDTVIVTGGLTAGPTLLAYHRSTGELLWKSGTDKASYSSPLLTTVAGQPAILSFNAAALTVTDPATGVERLRQVWSRDGWPKAAQPVVLPGDRIFVTAGYGMGCEVFQWESANDTNTTTNTGARDAQPGLRATSVWKNLRLKAQFNSVGYRDGFLYGLDDGSLACVDAATGERRWKEGRFGSGQSLVVGELVLIQAEPGDVVLTEATPSQYRELGRIKALSSKTWNHPALAGSLLVVRNDREAVAYQLPE